MPGQRSSRRRGERRLEDALASLASALNEAAVPWSVIGGIAVIARGVRRLTTDLDVVVRGDAIGCASLLSVLARYAIEPRIEDAQTFADTNLVLLLEHRPTGVEVDLSLGWTEFEQRAIAASTSTAFGRIELPMARPVDLVVYKAIAGRPRDLEDVRSLLVLYPSIDRAEVRARVAELAALAEAPELLTGLRVILRELPPGPSSAAPARRKPPRRPGARARPKAPPGKPTRRRRS